MKTFEHDNLRLLFLYTEQELKLRLCYFFVALGAPAVNLTGVEWQFFYMCLTLKATEILFMPVAGCKSA